ncbi:MAG: carbohydrate kinase family protein [Spirochaetaceae bacterium]|jgi:sugar/nucleoside kinase (ribokinase family)|nr:carbohydrate kinase family protein [Spirochaetaceae bacterium]
MNIHGTGCGILDCIYADEDFSGPGYRTAMSKTAGDGGLTPGRLVFSSALEQFMGRPYDEVMALLNGGKVPDTRNLGGPSAVSLAHASQMLADADNAFAVRYYGVRGGDETGDALEEKFSALPFADVKLLRKDCPNSRVDVLSDPRYDNGSGERTFVYRKGSLDEFYPADLTEDFFDAALAAFGGTALTPHLHDGLTPLLKKARRRGAVTEVNLVYDYRSELENPGQKWRLGLQDDAYSYIDLLLADQEEALKTSGKPAVQEAAAWFLEQGCGAAVITRGRKPLLFCAASGTAQRAGVFGAGRSLFQKAGLTALPVCEKVNRELAACPERRGDTTGCGDNFTGQVIAGLAKALAAGQESGIDLREICIPAVAAGGFCCFTVGGTYYEKEQGEKRRLLEPYISAYRSQLAPV